MIETKTEASGSVLRIVLNRPKANILDSAMTRSIGEALDQQITPNTRLLVFEGAGANFCYGASVEEHQADQAESMLGDFHGLFRKLAKLAVPTCAVVRGQCLGGGLELASWCTWIVATPDALLGQPEIKLAVFPPMASILLPWRIGGRGALDLCVSGRSITAQEALDIGLVNAVVEDPEAWWRDLLQQQLLKTSASSLRFAELAARTQLIRQLDRDLPDLERLYLEELMNTHDGNEGINAFVERRRPEYTNQ